MNWHAVVDRLFEEAKAHYQRSSELAAGKNELIAMQALTEMATANTLRALALALNEGLK